MLENMKLDQKLDKEEYKKRKDALSMRLGELQRACKDAGIPVMFVFEGFGASGKGTQINELIYGLDPGAFRYMRRENRRRKRLFAHICGGSGQRRRSGGGSRFLITAGRAGADRSF